MTAALRLQPETPEHPFPVLDFSALDRLPRDTDLPYSDGVPMDNWWHGLAVSILIDSIECHWQGRQDFFAGGDMFMYFSTDHVFTRDFRGPDFFVVRGVDRNRVRNSWVSWHEGGRLPNVIIELQSESSGHTDHVTKRAFYGERFRVPEYFIYNPAADEWTGYRLDGDRYEQPLAQEDGRIWSRQLELFVGTWTGPYQNHVRRWPRLFDKNGTVAPIFAAAAQAATAREQADQARRLADAEAKGREAAESEVARLKAELERLRTPNP